MASSYQKMLHQQAVHMAAPTSPASPFNKSLANREPSTHGQQLPKNAASTGRTHGSTDQPCITVQ
jgi:hypothetical protein